MAFEGIIGQERIVEILKSGLINRSLSHAYLFEGVTGLGKKKLAIELSKGLICSSEEEVRPCNTCQCCKRIEEGNHTEVKLMEEEGTIKIEKIRELQKEIQLKPYEGTKKVFIINNAEDMTTQAQNALLKTLEEPPSYATIILLTTNSNSLLPTIISRCQIFKLRPVEMARIQRALMDRGVSTDESKVMASFSNGIFGKAIRLLEEEDFRQRRGQVIQLTEEVFKGNTVNLLENIDFFLDNKNSIEEILDILSSWYRDLIVYKETQEFHFIMNCDKIEIIRGQSNRIGLKKLTNIISIIDKTKSNMKSNVNYQLNIEMMLLNIQEELLW